MNEIGLPSRLPPTGATQAYTPPRVGSESERATAASSVTTPTPGSGSTSTPPTPTVGTLSETVSISSDAYRLQQANPANTEAVDSTADGEMNSEQAMALLQTVREAMAQNPQSLFQAQTSQINGQRAGLLLA
jgi:hypothetical protein